MITMIFFPLESMSKLASFNKIKKKEKVEAIGET